MLKKIFTGIGVLATIVGGGLLLIMLMWGAFRDRYAGDTVGILEQYEEVGHVDSGWVVFEIEEVKEGPDGEQILWPTDADDTIYIHDQGEHLQVRSGDKMDVVVTHVSDFSMFGLNTYVIEFEDAEILP